MVPRSQDPEEILGEMVTDKGEMEHRKKSSFDAVGDAIAQLDQCLGGNNTACEMLERNMEVHSFSPNKKCIYLDGCRMIHWRGLPWSDQTRDIKQYRHTSYYTCKYKLSTYVYVPDRLLHVALGVIFYDACLASRWACGRMHDSMADQHCSISDAVPRFASMSTCGSNSSKDTSK